MIVIINHKYCKIQRMQRKYFDLLKYDIFFAFGLMINNDEDDIVVKFFFYTFCWVVLLLLDKKY